MARVEGVDRTGTRWRRGPLRSAQGHFQQQPERRRGGVDLLTPDEKRLRFRVVGLRWRNDATDEAVWIARLQDCEGFIEPPSRILWDDAFEGLDASVRITYRTGGLEQDILLHEVPPLPDGWDPERASIEVVTEFVECPAPRTQSLDVGAAADAGLAGLAGGSRVTYEILDFGAMQIMGGVAFAEPSAEAGAWGRPEAPVRKQWSLKEGPRPRLIERLDYPALRALSEKLPRQAQRASHPGPTRLAAASAPRATGAPMAIASRSRPVPAAVIDFDTVHSCPSQVFATDQTYRLDSQVTISSLTEFQSGAILKFRDAGSLIVSGTLTSPDPVRPRVYFTHVDDDTIGEPGLGDGVLDTGYPCALRLFNMAQASTV